MSAFEYFFDDNNIPDLSKEQEWSIKFNTINRKIGSLREEAVFTAKSLAEKASNQDRPLCLHLSGGDDSVAMVLSMLEIKAEFLTVTRIYKSNGVVMNHDDVVASVQFAKRMGLKHQLDTIEDIDGIWRTTDLENLRDMTALASRLSRIKHADKFNVVGTSAFIIGENSEWKQLTTFSGAGRPDTGSSFFLDNPEIYLSLLSDKSFEVVAPAINVLNILVEQATQVAGKTRLAPVFLYEKVVKAMIMHNAWPELQEHPRVKNTGFEIRPPQFNSTPTLKNKQWADILWKKVRTIPLTDVRSYLRDKNPTKLICQGGM